VLFHFTCQIFFGTVLVAALVLDAVPKLGYLGSIGDYQCQIQRILKFVFAKMNPCTNDEDIAIEKLELYVK